MKLVPGFRGILGAGTPAAVPTQAVWDEPPILETESFDMTAEGIEIGAPSLRVVPAVMSKRARRSG